MCKYTEYHDIMFKDKNFKDIVPQYIKLDDIKLQNCIKEAISEMRTGKAISVDLVSDNFLSKE